MSCRHPSLAVILALSAGLVTPVLSHAQVIIPLNWVIGITGTNAATVAGAGNAVNHTGYASNSGATVLTAAGSSGASAFDFNTGFSDTLDRATGSTAGAPNVWADLKYDSSSTGPLILDTHNTGSFANEAPLPGFGMHGDTFITFDLGVIRASAGLTADAPLTLSGIAGIANTSLAPTSGAIIADSTQLAVFDWQAGAGNTLSTFSLTLSGTTRYLTFAGLSGLDADNYYAHVGFANVQLLAVPEPSSALLLAPGLLLLGVVTRRARASRAPTSRPS